MNFLRNSKRALLVFLKNLRHSSRHSFSINSHEQHEKELVHKMRGRIVPSWQQLIYFHKILSLPERIVFACGWILIITALCISGFSFYKNHTVNVPEKGGKYIEGVIGNIKHINPILLGNNDVDRDIAKLVFSGLFTTDKNGGIVPDLAESYTVSEDQKTYTIILRHNIKWDDGEPITVDDIAFTIETIQDPELNSPLRYVFADTEFSIIDDATVQFVLKEPFAPFLSNLTVGILPEHAWSEIALNNYQISELNQKPIGSGMYKFESFEKDRSDNIRSYTLVRNELYHGHSPYLDQIIFKFYPTFETLLEAMHEGNIDGMSYAPAQYLDAFKNEDDIVLHNLSLPQYTALFFNPKQNKVLGDKSVRQALSIALNKEDILNHALGKEGVIIHAPILPGYLGYHGKVKQYNYDPGYSEFLLEQAGWKKDGNNIRTKNKEELHITISVRDQQPVQRVAEMIKKSWEAIGVKVDVDLISRTRIQREVIKPRSYQTLLFSQIVGADPDPYPFWHSSQTNDPGLGLSIFSNKDIDNLLTEARSTNDNTVRYSKYIEFQNLLSELAYAIFLYNPTYSYPQSDKIKGFDLERINEPSDRFNNIAEWYIYTNQKWRS